MQIAIQRPVAEGSFNLVEYYIQKGWSGYRLSRKLRKQLEENGFHIGSHGHIVLEDSPEQRPFPGFLYGNLWHGYHLRVHLPNTGTEHPASKLKDICDRF